MQAQTSVTVILKSELSGKIIDKKTRTLTVCEYCNKGKQQSGNWWHHI
jgi:hypothetical protein